jgi:hypothetical protein
MNHFEEPDKKPKRKVVENNTKNKKTDVSEEQYAQNKQKKQYKLKKNELRSQELWDEWESDSGSRFLY